MAYTLPEFNLSCNIFRYVAPPGPLVVVASSPDCNLQFARRPALPFPQFADNEIIPMSMWLLLPPLTDIRGPQCYPAINTTIADLVEVPAGSGRFYLVFGVDDVGKGFGNEFRCAGIGQTSAYGVWPAPIP